MPLVWQKGGEEAIAKIKRLRAAVSGRNRVRLELSKRTINILSVNAARGRNVTNLSADEERELQRLVESRLKALVDADGKTIDDAAARDIWREAGEWMRRVLADKIEDKRPVTKRPLSRAYAERKREEWGNRPILVASGDMLENVREARVRVDKG